jgi:hypothetical protein
MTPSRITPSRRIVNIRPVFSSMMFSIRRTRARRPQYLSISESHRSPCVLSFSSSVAKISSLLLISRISPGS